MKIEITFKTPDAAHYAAEEIATHHVDEDSDIDSLDAIEVQGLIDEKMSEIKEFLKRWIKYGETVTIEFDTDTDTATVKKV